MTHSHTAPHASHTDPRVGAVMTRATTTIDDVADTMRQAVVEIMQAQRGSHGLHTYATIAREARRLAEIEETVAEARRTLIASLAMSMTQDELASVTASSPRSVARYRHRVSDIMTADPAHDFVLDAEGRWSLRTD